MRAAQEVIDGKLDSHFVLDIFQTGSGTSTNMNANEVIANRASELLGGSRGSRKVHPNDHVNFGQSSNDVIPTAIHLSALVSIEHDLIPALLGLHRALEHKADEFMPIIKTGRTHLQDATPIRLGQEFLGYAGQVERGITRMRHAQGELSEVALGGTAVGTGVNTHPEFAGRVCRRLAEMNGVSVHETSNHFQAQNTLDNIVEASGALEHAGGQFDEDRQRHSLAWVGAARGYRRDRFADCAAGQLDYAGQGQPGDSRVGVHGVRPGDGQPYHDYRRGTIGQLRDQRDDARHGLQPAAIDQPAGGCRA